MKSRSFWVPLVVSLVLTPVFLLLGLGSAGAGHGDYVLARILFPYAMLAMLASDAMAGGPLIALAVAQYPLYGLALGAATRRGRSLATLVAISAAHAVAAALCFLPLNESFQ